MNLSLDRRLRLVLVDGHERARRALTKRLAGHEQLAVVGQTADPMELRELVRNRRPHVALIDPVRDDGRGREIVASLTSMSHDERPLAVIHVAFFDPELWRRLQAAGADDLLLKQLDVDALAARLLSTVIKLLPKERWPAILLT